MRISDGVVAFRTGTADRLCHFDMECKILSVQMWDHAGLRRVVLGGSSGGLLFLRVSGTFGATKKTLSAVLDLQKKKKKKKKGGLLDNKLGGKGLNISVNAGMSSVQKQIRNDVKEGKANLATEEDNPFVGFKAKGAAAKKLEWQLCETSASSAAPIKRDFATNRFEEGNDRAKKKPPQSDYMTFDKVRGGDLLSGAAKTARNPPAILRWAKHKDSSLANGRGVLPSPPKITDHRNGRGALPPLPGGGGARGMNLPPTPSGAGSGVSMKGTSYAEQSAAELGKDAKPAMVLEDAGGLYCTNPLAIINSEKVKLAATAGGSDPGGNADGGGFASRHGEGGSAGRGNAPPPVVLRRPQASDDDGGEGGARGKQKKKKKRLSVKSFTGGLKKLTLKRGAKRTVLEPPKEHSTLKHFEC